MNRQRLLWLALAGACLVPQGCKHSPGTVQAATAAHPTAPPIQVPPPSVREDELKAQAQAPAPPQEEEPAQEEPQQPRRTPRRRPQQPAQPTPTPSPTQTASVGTPAPDPASVIGELSTGGEISTQSRQQAGEFIAATQRRLDGLSGSLVRSHKAAVDQVKDFLLKAREALKAGDLEGATNLTTKAKLLLDDIAR
ncbi:hypothetical protein [Terriglobus tenax]|uniref:hypothetical protein n=1 Tax=Terriglobus tenax TaxID=1111115 RepID=UPI0021E0B8F3|nr:hypothetical protein [Terriglobus tenax]